MTDAMTVLVRQSGDGFYLTGSGAFIATLALVLLLLIAMGVWHDRR